MSLPAHLLPHTVARVRPSTSTDAHGNTVRNYTVPPATSANISAWVQQDNRKEPLSDGRAALEQLWLLMTNETDILGRDRIIFGSLTFEVEGPPEPVYTPAGFHHTEATLRKVDG